MLQNTKQNLVNYVTQHNETHVSGIINYCCLTGVLSKDVYKEIDNLVESGFITFDNLQIIRLV